MYFSLLNALPPYEKKLEHFHHGFEFWKYVILFLRTIMKKKKKWISDVTSGGVATLHAWKNVSKLEKNLKKPVQRWYLFWARKLISDQKSMKSLAFLYRIFSTFLHISFLNSKLISLLLVLEIYQFCNLKKLPINTELARSQAFPFKLCCWAVQLPVFIKIYSRFSWIQL